MCFFSVIYCPRRVFNSWYLCMRQFLGFLCSSLFCVMCLCSFCISFISFLSRYTHCFKFLHVYFYGCLQVCLFFFVFFKCYLSFRMFLQLLVICCACLCIVLLCFLYFLYIHLVFLCFFIAFDCYFIFLCFVVLCLSFVFSMFPCFSMCNYFMIQFSLCVHSGNHLERSAHYVA